MGEEDLGVDNEEDGDADQDQDKGRRSGVIW